MPSMLVVTVLALPVILYLGSIVRSFLDNLAAAKRSGIKYVVVPIYLFDKLWLAAGRWLFVPYLEKLPASWTRSWLPVVTPDWTWDLGYSIFDQLGADTFLTVAPGGIALWTSEPEGVAQMTSRRADFPKPTEFYGLVNIYGPNVVGSEGATWRHHRKITAPPFTERNNELVWAETMDQTRAMLAAWIGQDGHGFAGDMGSDTMRLTLHVISRAGFGRKMTWPGHNGLQRENKDVSCDARIKAEINLDSSEVSPGHNLSYKDALSTILKNLLWVMILPHAILKISPLRVHKEAWKAYVEWRHYMTEMYTNKKAEISTGASGKNLDLMGALVMGGRTNAKPVADDSPTTDEALMAQPLTEDEILGNAFIFLLAGHETTATTVQMALLYLACNPACQAQLQQELDDVFGNRPSSDWNYEQDLPKLLGGYSGAIMNETLRLIPPVVGIPKVTRTVQTITLGGRQAIIPANTLITFNVAAAHRNPKTWPKSPSSSRRNPTEDMASFSPERWFLPVTKAAANVASGVPTSQDSASNMFHPPRGAFLAFSEGHRACLGRRFAQVEVMAVLATIFRDYSIELAVEPHASLEVTKLPKDDPERRELWQRAKARADGLMTDGMGSVMTLTMKKGQVPITIVRRGQEQFR